MKLIVGLGNPGVIHKNNRHNAGFMVVDRIAELGGQNLVIKWENKLEAEMARIGESLLVKPGAFMNRSGEAVAKIMRFYKIGLADLIVVHDDLDIHLGEYKLATGVGPKVHNGLNSVEEELGQKDFWRVRIGIDNRSGGNRILGEKYVLEDFTDDEKAVVDGVIEKAVKEIISLL